MMNGAARITCLAIPVRSAILKGTMARSFQLRLHRLRIPSAKAIATIASSGLLSLLSAEEEPTLDFNRDVRPILSDKCFFCHGPDEHERKADLRLDVAEGAFADLGGYAAIIPGKPDESEFVYRLTDEEDLMPPEDSHKKLTPEEIGILTRWVEEGATYSEPWAYVAPRKRDIPVVEDNGWPANWVDRFVLSRLEGKGLSPSPDADRVTLVRRLHFDLTGLPPTPDRVRSFVEDKRDLDIAWGELVDELLASPHFGERLAIYWLDLVRYADTVGYHGDQDHSISPYRDYVIRSFNENLPFDQFTREQLAGDLLPGSGKWQKIASGYNRLLQTSHEGGVQLKEYDAIYAADRVRNLSAVWMGATIGCAQCHDHKYDPYTIRDHYALAAFFSDIHDRGFSGNTLPSNRPPEITIYSDEQEAELARLDEEIEAVLPPDVRSTLEKLEAEEKKLIDQRKKAREPEGQKKLDEQISAKRDQITQAAPEEKRARWSELRSARSAIEKQGRRTMITVAEAPRTMRVLPRGNWLDDTGEIVEPAVPAFLGLIEPREGDRADRLDLANWLVDSEAGIGGLTARVFANRFWYLFFGTGISRSLEDFGGQGVPPANPELLDQLAVSFVENGWDMKKMVRLLVTGRAYRQASVAPAELREIDPHNQLVARQSRYRLPAELIRDNALAVSGLLVVEPADGTLLPDSPAGPSVKPYQPAGYYRHLNFPTRKYQSNRNESQWRRGVYVHWQRMFLHPMLKAMDAPSREECTAERPRSNTPNAALVLLNDPTFVEAARAFAARILQEEPDDFSDRLKLAYQIALSREPDEEETRLLRNLYEKTRAEYESDPAKATSLAKIGQAPVPGSIPPVELASWTAVTRALLNLNETVTRN